MKKRLGLLATLVTIWIGSVQSAFSVCPASACTPSTNTAGPTDGIFYYELLGESGVSFASADAQTEGYVDSSCVAWLRDTLVAGRTYTLKVKVDNIDTHRVKVWIDFDGDGTLATSELVIDTFGVDTVEASFTVPPASAIAVFTVVRLRILGMDKDIADTMSTLGPCSAIDSGQFEDYSVYLAAKPEANFTYTTTCNRTVTFTDQSLYNPTSWSWDFGDGNNSTLQNPTHTYAVSGIYQVTLIASNQWGSDTVQKNVTAIYLMSPSCEPGTGVTCCGEGIFRYELLGETGVVNNSGDAASEGYVDFACQPSTLDTLFIGGLYYISVQTDPYSNQLVRAWIDFNSDGIFDPTEQVMNVVGVQNHLDSFIVPASAVADTIVRVRVVGVAYNSAWPPTYPGPCDTVDYGQYEDYAVVLKEPTVKPIARFKAIPDETCDGVVQFQDQSLYLPTSWHWDFGDGNTSTQQNPVHTYTSSGTYTVELVVGNANGYDTAYQTVVVSLGAAPTVPPACTPNPSQSPCLGYGIYRVQLYSLDVSSGCSDEGYQDFTCVDSVHIMEGKWHTIHLWGHPTYPQDWRVYIDYNNDGKFTADELALKADNSYPGPGGRHDLRMRVRGGTVLLNTPLRMRVITDIAGNIANFDSSCYVPLRGQVEDYTVVLTENPYPPIADWEAEPIMHICYPAPVKFYDSSENSITSWFWDFGDGRTSTVPNPIHYYLKPGLYTVKLRVCGPQGCDSLIRYNYIYVDSTCYLVASPNTILYTNRCEGVLYDDGGPTNNYLNFGNGGMRIELLNGDTIWFRFEEFDMVSPDHLRIFCKGDTLGAPDYQFTGNTLPNNGQPLFCASSTMIVQEKLINDNQVAAGFKMRWWSNARPVANIGLAYYVSDVRRCEDEYLFLNTSYCSHDVHWYFEDFTDTTDEHVYHMFYGSSRSPLSVDPSFPRTLFEDENIYRDEYYQVVLVARNRYGTDTVVKQVLRRKVYADFVVDPMPPHLFEKYTWFYDNTVPRRNIKERIWRVSDGTTYTIVDKFRHEFDTAGLYWVELKVCNNVGCCDSVRRYIRVYEEPFTLEATAPTSSSSLAVFPQPAHVGEPVYIVGLPESEKIMQVLLIDLMGRMELLQYDTYGPNVRVHLPYELASGRYSLHLVTSEGVWTVPLLVQND